MRINIIGIDCATNPVNVGIAFGRFCNGHTVVKRIQQGSSRERPADIVPAWLKGQDDPTLLALDAPLGWPKSLAEELSEHIAGRKFKSSANDLFRRTTDIFIKRKIGKQSLDVGADRIARTAHSALQLLDNLRKALRQDIELAWEPTIYGISAIEVYPAATLIAHGIDTQGYKSKDGLTERRRVINALKDLVEVSGDIPNIERRSDCVDAIACVLAGHDFLSGHALPPSVNMPVLKEGWIWVRRPNAQADTSKRTI